MIGWLKLIKQLLGAIPVLKQLSAFLWQESKNVHADKRRQSKDDEVDRLIADALADSDGLRHHEAGQQHGTD